jgi:hypothetical protein
VPASDSFLNAAAALLCVGALWHVPWIRRHAGAGGLALGMVGALLPLLDPLRFAIVSEDQIAYLTQDPVFAGPLPGLAAIALASGAALVLGMRRRRCLRLAAWAAAGVLVPMVLNALTPEGTPWLAPFDAERTAWPVLPAGHGWLIAALGAGLAAAELWPRGGKRLGGKHVRGSWALVAAGGVVAVQLAIGIVGQVSLRSRGTTTADTLHGLELDPFWPGRWLDIVADGDTYTAVTRGLGSAGDTPEVLPRWNDQGTLLRLLEDPVLRRFYYDVFRHPVATVSVSDSQIRLTMRELADTLVGAQGPTLLYETDAHGRLRRYQVERLD